MEPKWSNYTQVGVEQGFDLYQRKRKSGKGPRFAFRSTSGTFKGAWGGANNLTDIKIRVDEYLKFHIGLGISTGYRMGGGPTMEPEEIYRKVGIGSIPVPGRCRGPASVYGRSHAVQIPETRTVLPQQCGAGRGQER